MARGNAEWQYISLPARTFKTIRVDVREHPSPLDAVKSGIDGADIKDAVVRLMIQMVPEQEPLLRDADLMPMFQQAFFTQINRDVDRDIRDRLSGLEPNDMTPTHLLKRFLEGKGKSEEDIDLLMNAAERVFSDDGDDDVV